MHRSGSAKHPPNDPEWIWAEPGAGAFCCEAQADGVPCFEVGKDCAECEQGKEGWLRMKEEQHLRKTRPRYP